MSGTVTGGALLTSAEIGVPPWTAMVLGNSWVNTGSGFVTAQYRKWALRNEVEIIGAISNGTITDGTIIATLPFTPVSTQELKISIRNASGGATGDSPVIQVNSSGQLQVFHLPTGTTDIAFRDEYSLDA